MSDPKILSPAPEATAATSTGSRREHFPGIHGLRAAAALAIVAYHTCYISKPALAVPTVLTAAVSNLALGVHIFFILSTFSLLHSNNESSLGKGWKLSYAIKRFFRIAPLFYLLVFYNYGSYAASLPIGTLVANLAFVFNFFPDLSSSAVWAGWTIGVEMPIYALLPFVIHQFRHTGMAIGLTAAAFVVSIVSRILLADTSLPQDYAYYSCLGNLSVFATGALAHRLVKTGLIKGLWLLTTILGAVAGLVMLALVPYQIHNIGPSLDMLLWSIPFGCLCIWQAVLPSRLLACPLMQWIGERSFSVYLLHPFIVYKLWEAGVYTRIYSALQLLGPWAYLVCFAVTAALVLLASALTYSLVERPGQRLGNLLIRLILQRKARLEILAAANLIPLVKLKLPTPAPTAVL